VNLTGRILAPLTFLFVILPPFASSAEEFAASAAAEIQNYPTYIQDAQRIKRFEVGLLAKDPDKVLFSAYFINGISPTTMATSGSRVPLLRIKIYNYPTSSNSSAAQLTIDAPVTPYRGAERVPALINSSCGATTWMPPGANVINFEISRSCLDLPDKFYVSLFLDVDVNQNNNDYINIPELNTLALDASKYPKPKKPDPKKDQIIAGYPAQQSYTLDVTTAYFSTSTNSGLPIQIIGKNNSVCMVTSSTTISLVGTGTCVVGLSAPGNDLWNPSSEVTFSFNVLPKKVIPKVDQNLYFNRPGTLYENTGEYRLDIYTDTRLEVKVVSSTPDVCMFPYSAPDNTVVKIYTAGTCAFTVSQAGNERYNPSSGSTSIQIYAVAKPAPPQSGKKPSPAPAPVKPKAPQGLQILSESASTSGGSKAGASAANGGNALKFGEKKIICIKKGSASKEVVGKTPKCPKGYTEKK
jgi:hypothetical protein